MTPSAFFIRSPFNRRFLAINFIIIVALFLSFFFPRESSLEKLLAIFLILSVLPILFIRIILKEPFSSYGLTWGKKTLLFNIVSIFSATCIFAFFLWGFIIHTDIGQEIAQTSNVADTRKNFILFLLSVGSSTWFLLQEEFFFRGFFLLTWKRFVGKKSLLLYIALTTTVLLLDLNIFFGEGKWTNMIIPFINSVFAALLSFITESIFVSFCFSLFSAILTMILFLIVL